MCEFLKNLFKPKLAIPYPEEPINPGQTIANLDKDGIFENWLVDYSVPAQHWDFWKNQIKLAVYDEWPAECLAVGIKTDTPAYTINYGTERHFNCLAHWFNPGVIAHEQAHNSYDLLTSDKRMEFIRALINEKNNPWIALLQKAGKLNSGIVESHAEIYRYLGMKLPDNLKEYYPKLF